MAYTGFEVSIESSIEREISERVKLNVRQGLQGKATL